MCSSIQISLTIGNVVKTNVAVRNIGVQVPTLLRRLIRILRVDSYRSLFRELMQSQGFINMFLSALSLYEEPLSGANEVCGP